MLEMLGCMSDCSPQHGCLSSIAFFFLIYLRVKMMIWMWSQTLMMPASTATLFQMGLQAVVAAVAKNSKLGKRKRKVLTLAVSWTWKRS